MTVTWNQRRNRFRYSFFLNGERYQNYCVHPDTGEDARTKTAAKAFEEMIRARLRSSRGVRPALPGTYTLIEAFEAYAKRVTTARNWPNIQDYIRELTQFFGATTPAETITEAECYRYVEWARSRPKRVWVGGPDRVRAAKKKECWRVGRGHRSEATINRYLSALRAALRLAHRTRDPGDQSRVLLPLPPVVPWLKVPRRLPRPPSASELSSIIRSAPQHTVEAAQASALTGMRRAEVLRLEIRHVDLENGVIRLDGADTKGNRDEAIPLLGDTAKFFRRLVKQARERKVPWLIAYRAKDGAPWRPLKSILRSWNSAQARAGMDRRYRFHDVKAHFVTAIIEHTDASTAQQLARHRSFETTRSYLAVVDDRKRAALASANAVLGKLANLRGRGRPRLSTPSTAPSCSQKLLTEKPTRAKKPTNP